MRELALFAGGGGGVWASLLLGHTTVCAVEIVEANRRILLQRQLDGMFPRFPIWDDVRTFSGHEWRGKVDIVSGGFPCQDISCAGKGAGIDGERSGLWSEMARIIGEVRPRYAFIENSPMLVTRGLDRVLCDLAAMGFDAEWGVVGAHHVGAPHKRDRAWVLAMADASSGRLCRPSFWQVEWARGAEAFGASETVADSSIERLERPTRENVHGKRWAAKQSSSSGVEVADAASERRREARQHQRVEPEERACWCGADADTERVGLENEQQGRAAARAIDRPGNGHHQGGWPPEPGICRGVDGVANWKHRIFSLGNGQVPRVAAAAWRILSERAE